jgi:hypothetical protein
MTSVEYIILGIKYPIITTTNGRLTYEGINKISRQIYANALGVDSHRGSINGHLGQIMSPATYLAMSSAPFITPSNPGQLPPRQRNLFPQQWDTMKLAHKRGAYKYTTSNNLDKAVKQHVIKVITDPIFLTTLENHISG